MNATTVKAADLMQTNVARIEAGTPVHEALRLLGEDRISGAPVVDAANSVLGVVSYADLAEALESSDGQATSTPEYYMPEDVDDEIDLDPDEFEDKDTFSPEVLGGSTVDEWMSRVVISVPPTATLREVCRKMAQNRVHRVLVLENKKLVGILSTFDVVRWVSENG